MKDYIEVGFIKKPKGLKGELLVVLHGNDDSFFEVGDFFTLEDQKKLQINSYKLYKESFLFTFKGVDDRNKSDALKGQKLFISKELANSFNTSEEVFLATLLEYEFYNFEKKIGKVIGFLETKAHDILEVELKDGGIVEIPWVSEFLVEVNHELKKVHFNAPQELTDPEFFESGKKS